MFPLPTTWPTSCFWLHTSDTFGFGSRFGPWLDSGDFMGTCFVPYIIIDHLNCRHTHQNSELCGSFLILQPCNPELALWSRSSVCLSCCKIQQKTGGRGRGYSLNLYLVDIGFFCRKRKEVIFKLIPGFSIFSAFCLPLSTFSWVARGQGRGGEEAAC